MSTEGYAAVGTVRDRSGPDAPFSHSAPKEVNPGARRVAWVLAGAAALVTVFGIIAIAVLLRTVGDGIPVVTDIRADVGDQGRVEFSWPDPGIAADDRYQLTLTEDGIASNPALQAASRFVVDADPGDTVCLSVLVNRNGTPGAASAEKCVDVTGG